MSTASLRTADGWWVEADGHARRVPTKATTTAELLADRAAIAAASSEAPVALDGLALLSPVTTPCRVVAQMVNYRSHAIDSDFAPAQVPTTFFRKASGSVTGPTGTIVEPTHVKLLDYCAELPIALLASEAVGIVSPLNPALAAGDVVRLLAVSRAKVLVAAGPDLSAEL